MVLARARALALDLALALALALVLEQDRLPSHLELDLDQVRAPVHLAPLVPLVPQERPQVQVQEQALVLGVEQDLAQVKA